jgi:osmotically-inducible protein OsmY
MVLTVCYWIIKKSYLILTDLINMNASALFSSKRLGMVCITAALLLPTLNACAPLIFAGVAGGTAIIAADRRHPGTQAADEGTQLEAEAALNQTFGDSVHIRVSVFNRRLVLTGEVPNTATSKRAEQIVRKLGGAKEIFNELEIASPNGLSTRSRDALITTQIKSQFLAENNVPSSSIRIVTERGVVYLLGLVTNSEAKAAIQIVQNTSSVVKVIALFEIITEAERVRLDAPNPPPSLNNAP